MELKNRINKDVLKKQLAADNTARTTLSFYRYVKIADPNATRDQLYKEWSDLGVLGRIYLAEEGVNSQMSVPTENFEKFRANIDANHLFTGVPFKIAVEDDGKSFYKLAIKVKEKIVADGLDDKSFDPGNTGRHLTAKEFNEAMEEGAVVVDMRNHYESEVGHFENAIKPDADTFREEIQLVKELLKGKEDEKVLFYCTGGIRCEKASAYFKHLGFKDVNQLKGGIIDYAHQIRQEKIESKFKGKNFVFDERIGEKITDDIVSNCHQCSHPCDTHTNCRNDACHLLFIQCEKCDAQYDGCCTKKCQEISNLPIEEQRKLRKGIELEDSLSVYKSRLRPRLDSTKV